MGLKSKMRSMNRGTYHRDREPPTKNSGYENKGPELRKEDLAFLGGTKERLRELAAELKPTILTFAKGGVRKPARVSLLLNKAGKKTPSGDFWNPRLVYFLLSEIFKGSTKPEQKRQSEAKKDGVTTKSAVKVKPTSKPLTNDEIVRNRARAEIVPAQFSEAEMKRRLQALQVHFND